MEIPIEDFFEDIIGKTQRGLKIDDESLAGDAGIDVAKLQSLKGGEFDEDAVRKVAPHLKLDADALVVSGQKGWRPEPVDLEGLAVFNTPFEDMEVNAYLVWDPASKKAAAFDSGADASAMADKIRTEGLDLVAVFLTHTHPDHIADLGKLKSVAPDAPLYANTLEPHEGAELFDEGRTFEVGGLTINTATTSGHSVGGTTFVIEGLARPVAVVGDAIFAGSMGGGMISFPDALENNRTKIMTLPGNTVICPGHGPLSSVAEEKAHNPFFPEFK